LRFQTSKKLWFEDHTFHFLNSIAGEDSGKPNETASRLFTHRDLWAWLNHPFQIDPAPYEPEQLRFNLT
jgi:hypothetical protein